MLDVNDFIAERGGNPQKIKDSQRRRYAPEEVVDEVIAMYEDHRKSKPVNTSPSISLLTNYRSPVRSYTGQQQDQRNSERDWRKKEGQGGCYRFITKESRFNEGEEDLG